MIHKYPPIIHKALTQSVSGYLNFRVSSWLLSLFILAPLSLFLLTSDLSAETGELYAQKNPKKEGVVRLHFIDIGQGDSALIEGPTGKRVLIDSGPSKSGDRLLDYLKALKIKRLDLMINTHPHSDHIGNAARVLKEFEVGVVLDSGWVHPIRAYRDLIEAVEVSKTPLKIARKGRKIGIGGGAEIEILGPEDPLIRNSRSDPNSNSIVFRLSYKGEQALFTGDAEEETEMRLMRSPKLLRASLLKVAHHGSRHASSDHFLSAVMPQVAVISCSERNRYGHPAPETLKRLERHHAQPWVTATQGTLVAETDGSGWVLNGASIQSRPAPKSALNTPAHAAAPEPVMLEGSGGGLVNVNSASLSELQTLPGIGPSLSKRIVQSRKDQGPFTSADDLSRVRGIGPKTVEKLRTLVRF